MARREIKSEGKDVATAIIRGLNELGRRRDQVEVTVIQEEKGGFLGIGGRPAIVHIIEKKWDSENSTPMKPKDEKKAPAKKEMKRKDSKRGGDRKSAPKGKGRKERSERPERAERGPKVPKENEAQKLPSTEIQNASIPEEMKEPMNQAKEALSQILGFMGTKTENLNVWWDGKQQRILLTFDCDHPAVIIGKEGKTLESIQYLITLMVSRNFDNPISVMADTQNYWRKLEDKIDNEIDKAVSMLKRTKRSYRFRPMPAQIRRYVHRYLADNATVSTVSEGEGKWRKVILRYQSKGAAAKNNQPVQDEPEEGVARCKADLTPVCLDNVSCDCGATGGETSCSCMADVQNPAPAENSLNTEESKTDAMANAEASSQGSAPEAVSTDNASCDCVVTGETTSCSCVADVQNPAPAENTANTEDSKHDAIAEAASNQAAVEPASCEAVPNTAAAETAAPLNSADSNDQTNTVSVDNVNTVCVVTAESTTCESVATTEGTGAEQAVHDAAHAEQKKEEVTSSQQ